MSDDKIEEIRARYSRDDHWRNSPSMICPQSHADRATLLAEGERQRAEIERLRKRDAEWTQVAQTWLASPEAERRLDGYRELAARVEGLTCERDEARAEVERLRKVYVLIATESAGIVEGGSIFEDKIAGCYASHQSADKAGENLGYVNWRIEEHKIISNALEGKP